MRKTRPGNVGPRVCQLVRLRGARKSGQSAPEKTERAHGEMMVEVMTPTRLDTNTDLKGHTVR